MKLLLFVAVACALAFIAASSGDEEFIGQREVLPPGVVARKNLNDGEGCSNSNQCLSGCCLRRDALGSRVCFRKGALGENCTEGQIKGGVYVDACPCETGRCIDNGVCTLA